MGPAMRNALILLAAFVAAPALAQGPLGTAERGNYVCELPGDAAGAAGIARPQENFTIASASRYQSARGDGTYLRQGDTIRFTGGPRKGEAYRIENANFLRRLGPDGEPGRLRCVRSGG
jgi:hypothetical protein